MIVATTPLQNWLKKKLSSFNQDIVRMVQWDKWSLPIPLKHPGDSAAFNKKFPAKFVIFLEKKLPWNLSQKIVTSNIKTNEVLKFQALFGSLERPRDQIKLPRDPKE